MAVVGSFRVALRSLGSVVRNQASFLRREWPTSYLQNLKHTAPAQMRVRPQGNDEPSWELHAAVCLTRLPVVCPNLEEIEQKYIGLLRKQEFERSVLSDWEEEKIRQTELIRAVEMGEKDPLDFDFKVAHQDIEDDNDVRLKEFLDSTDEDSSADDGNVKNINRKPRESLVYISKKKLGIDEVWVLPSLPILDGETVRQCAERALSRHTTDDFRGTILTNAPLAFFKYKFPKGVRLKNGDGFVGAKVFIYCAVARATGDVVPTEAEDYPNDCDNLTHAWVSKDELKKHLKPKYFEAVRRILY